MPEECDASLLYRNAIAPDATDLRRQRRATDARRQRRLSFQPRVEPWYGQTKRTSPR